jgi:hypothetical protein
MSTSPVKTSVAPRVAPLADASGVGGSVVGAGDVVTGSGEALVGSVEAVVGSGLLVTGSGEEVVGSGVAASSVGLCDAVEAAWVEAGSAAPPHAEHTSAIARSDAGTPIRRAVRVLTGER